jgi:hypothetical protein
LVGPSEYFTVDFNGGYTGVEISVNQQHSPGDILWYAYDQDDEDLIATNDTTFSGTTGVIIGTDNANAEDAPLTIGTEPGVNEVDELIGKVLITSTTNPGYKVTDIVASEASGETDILLDFNVDVVDADGDTDSALINVELDGDNIMGGQDYEGALSNEGPDVMVGGAENETFDGGSGDDVIVGGDGVDTIDGGAGNDILVADIVDFDGTDPGPTASEDDDSSPDILEDGDVDTVIGGAGDDDILIETDADEVVPTAADSVDSTVEETILEGETADGLNDIDEAGGGDDFDPLLLLIPPPEDGA